jgi:2-polyprenyl-6-methoxyphenol hydroxylase-like FAD-dependent oxidoreductase
MTNSGRTGSAGRAIVIGGSLGGLFAATPLHTQGWVVDVYERSPHDLDSRGGGIVLQPEVIEAFRRAGVRYDMAIGVEAKERVFLDRSGGIRHRIAGSRCLDGRNSSPRRLGAPHHHRA